MKTNKVATKKGDSPSLYTKQIQNIWRYYEIRSTQTTKMSRGISTAVKK